MAAKLKLVPKPNTVGSPPRPLGKHGLALWRAVTHEYGIVDCGGREMLAQACAALDRSEECAAAIDRDGVAMRVKAGLYKDNPLLKTELACRSFVVRTLQRLGLDVEAIKSPGRPGNGPGVLWKDMPDEH